MKKKWFTAILAVVVLTLALAGCAAGTQVAAGSETPNDAALTAAGQNDPIGAGISDGTARYGAGNASDTARYGAQNEAVGTGAGYRGNGNAGSGYGDDCVTTDTAGSTPYTATEQDKTLTLSGYGSEGALNDTTLSLADMLTYAVQDEYLARAEYDRILTQYGSIRPFTNIIRAEETHIDALLPLFTAYQIAAPKDEGANYTVSVSSLTEAYQAGVNAEINNIAMYETFLDQNLPDDVRTVFESLMRASENHLRAFQNQL